MRRLVAISLLAGVVGCAFGAAAPRPSGTWAGSLRLPAGSEPVAISVALRGGRAVVSLAPGHAARTAVPVRATSGRLRFSLPGRPARLAFDLRLRQGRLVGTARQGSVRGTATLHRGRALEAGTLGLYVFGDGRSLGAVQGFGQRAAILFEASEIRATYATAPGIYEVGSGLATRAPAVGRATFADGHAVWLGARAERVPLRQEEVHVPAGRHTLGCTLTIPPGERRKPAVAFAHGSGPAVRAFNSTLTLFFARQGIVVLSCDKRGIGQSGGEYPGEAASEFGIDAYARDVEAQARWLAAQPEVDAARVGLSGASQAGWIMPRAASREPAIRWLVLLVSPTVTVDESDLWGDLAGQGQFQPSRSDEALEADVRANGPGGVDPMPSIRSLRIPAIWIFGGKDRHVPTRLCVERLDTITRETGRDLSYAVFPHANHGLIESEHGLNTEIVRSSRYGMGVWTTIASWLRSRGLSSSP
jgi:dienelactone hydrolase